MEQEEITSEEKLISLISHLSVFFGGIIVPVIMWAVYKGKSKFIEFNSMQSLFFHILYIVFLFFLVIITAGAGMLLGLINDTNSPVDDPSLIALIFIFVISGVIILTVFGVSVYSIYTGVKSFNGEIKKYIFVGKIIYRKVYGNQHI